MTTVAQWSTFAKHLVKAAHDLLLLKPVTFDERGVLAPKVIGVTLLCRTMTSVNAAVALASAGFVVEARTIVRGCFENLYWLAGLLSDGVEFSKRIGQQQGSSQRKRAEAVLADESIHDALGVENIEQIRETLAKLTERFPRSVMLNPKALAEGSIFDATYVIYSRLSGDSAHPSFESLFRHLGFEEVDGEKVRTVEVAPIPKQEELEDTLNLACHAGILAILATSELIPTQDGFVELKASLNHAALAAEYQQLAGHSIADAADASGVDKAT
jgi:hypothetical protein